MPEIIDPSVAELGPNVYKAARIAGLDPAGSKLLNQLSKQYAKGKELIALGEAAGRNEFLRLDPQIQTNIRAFFPDREMFNEEKSLLQEVLSKVWKYSPQGQILRLAASPFTEALNLLEKYEKGYKTPYSAARQVGEAQEVTKRVDFSKAILKDAYDGKNNWQWEKVAPYEQRYGVAITTLARAMAEGRTVEGAIDLYGNADEEMMAAVVFMYDKPDDFNRIKEGLKVDAQISPGRDLVNEVAIAGKTIDGNYWQGVAQRLLGMQSRVVLPEGVSPESKRGKKIIEDERIRRKQKLSGTVDGFYTIFGDPLTYIGLGVPAIIKGATKGVGGIRATVREAIGMSAFKTKGQRFAAQFKFVSEKQGTEAGYAWLFNEPEIKTLWDDLGPRLKSYSEADSSTLKASILESIKMDYPEWYNDAAIKTLIKGEAFDAKSAQRFFTHVDDANLMLNGRVNGVSFRRNGIPYARRSRTVTSAIHRIAYATFNPTSELDTVTKEILDQGDERAKQAADVILKVADRENKLLNPAIDDLFQIQEDLSWSKKMAYRLGVAFSRSPGNIVLGEKSAETADNLRNTAYLVLPKDIANAVTIMLMDQPIDVQLTAVRNMQYAFMKRLNVPEEEIMKILQKTFNESAGFATVVDLPIASRVASEMHPMAVNFINGEAKLAATSAIIPAQLTKGIKQLPFDLIYQLSAKARFDNTTGKRFFIDGLRGATRSNAVRIWNNNWAAYTLAPRLGIRTNVDEGFFYYLTKPVTDILDLVASKFQKDIKASQAVLGSGAAIGPWKGSFYSIANRLGVTSNGKPLDPRKILTPAERGQIAEDVRLKLSQKLEREVSLAEVRPLMIKEALLSRIEDIIGVNSKEWENWKRLFRNDSNFLDSFISSMGARDIMVGKIDKDFFDSIFTIDQLTLFIKELGLERSPLYTPREVEKLNDLELGVAMWDNFAIRFGFNQVKILDDVYLNPVDVFFKHNGLKNEDVVLGSGGPSNFAKAREDLMRQMGAFYDRATGKYSVNDATRLQSALSNFGETVYLRQQGVSDAEIARIYAERMLTDMRFAFHGSAEGFNQQLFDLIVSKHNDIIDEFGPRTLNPWSRAANSLTWKEFDDATVGMRPTSGFINTRLVSGGKTIDLDNLKDDLSTIDKIFEKFPNTVLEMMDRQVTGFFRLPAMRVAMNKAFDELKPYEKMLSDRHYDAIVAEGNFTDLADVRAKADELADKTVTNIAVNMATNSVLEFVDNPNIRSNFALAIRHLGRFYRATEDFHRRVYRLYANEGPRYLMRMRLLHYGLQNFGSIYEDENGDEYITFPTDIAMNMAMQKVLSGFNIDYKVGGFNEFALKFRLTNPSFAPDAGQPAFSGPLAGIGIASLKAFLRDLPIVSAILPESWEKKIYPFTTEAANYIDTFAMGHIGQNTDLGDMIRSAFPMMFTSAWDAAMSPGEKNRIKANYVLQAASYLEAFGNGLPDNANAAEKKRYLNNLKTAASNVAIAQFMLGMVSPAYPSLKDGKGLPEFIKENGISTWTSAFWDVYQGILRSDTEVADPFALAVATFIGKNPGKAVYTISRTEKTSRVFIAKTNELKDWAQNNKNFLSTYGESGIGYIFAPKIGEYNPDIYNWMESQGLVKQADMAEYLDKVQIAVDKEKYFAIEDELNSLLSITADYSERSALISIADREQQLLKISNPELEEAISDVDNKGKLNKWLRDLSAANEDPSAPIPQATRMAMQLAIAEVRSFIEYSDNPFNKNSYSFSTNRAALKDDVMTLLRELTFDPAVKEATRLIFVPLMNQYSRDVISASPERG